MAWVSLRTSDSHRPGPRECHSLVSVGDTLYLFGGNDRTRRFSDLHAFDTGEQAPLAVLERYALLLVAKEPRSCLRGL
jgi:hypothetical protein